MCSVFFSQLLFFYWKHRFAILLRTIKFGTLTRSSFGGIITWYSKQKQTFLIVSSQFIVIFSCIQLFRTPVYITHILHGTIYYIFAYYMRTVQSNLRNLIKQTCLALVLRDLLNVVPAGGGFVLAVGLHSKFTSKPVRVVWPKNAHKFGDKLSSLSVWGDRSRNIFKMLKQSPFSNIC